MQLETEVFSSLLSRISEWNGSSTDLQCWSQRENSWIAKKWITFCFSFFHSQNIQPAKGFPDPANLLDCLAQACKALLRALCIVAVTIWRGLTGVMRFHLFIHTGNLHLHTQPTRNIHCYQAVCVCKGQKHIRYTDFISDHLTYI